MLLLPVGGWEYKDHPSYNDDEMKERAKAALLRLYQLGEAPLLAAIADTRPIHERYFVGLTPDGHKYFAGHYRGENFPRLIDYQVGIGGYLGLNAAFVPGRMDGFQAQLAEAVKELDWTAGLSDSVLSKPEKLYRIVEIAVALFVAFLSIHPYADGNGHMSRFILIGLMGRYGFWRVRMPVHPRPGPLGPLVNHYRGGNTGPLINYVLSAI